MPGRAYHVFARGDNKGQIFRDADDYQHFLTRFVESLQRFATLCLAYCLMANHYHLLIVPGEHPVSKLMQWLNSRYCQRYNKRHGRVGHVLQGRFGSRIVEDSTYLLSALRYIAMNPVAAEAATRPENFRWSSYRATAGLEPPPPFLDLGRVWHAFDCTDAAEGRARYIAHVAGGAAAEELQRALFFGGELLARQVHRLLEPHKADGELTYADRFATRAALDAVFANAASTEDVRTAAHDAFHRHAYTLREIGEFVGRTPSTISKWIRSQDRVQQEEVWHQNIGRDKFKI